jgi:group I intron endonuclease
VTPYPQSLALIRWSKPGIIYVARNRVNGKMYVGKTLNLLCNRKAGHKFQANCKSKLPFHEALRKYGIDEFEWSIVQRCACGGCLNEAEKWWIFNLATLVHNGYNVAHGGDGSSDTNLVRDRLGKSRKTHPPVSEETRKKLSIASKGRKHKPETLKKMSAWQLGRKRPEITGSKNWLSSRRKVEEGGQLKIQWE